MIWWDVDVELWSEIWCYCYIDCACGLFLLRQRISKNLKCMQISKWKAKSQRMLTVVWDFPRPGTPGCYTVPLGPCPPGTSGNADLMSPCGGSSSHQPPAAAGENRILGLAARLTLLSSTPGVCCCFLFLLSIMTHHKYHLHHLCPYFFTLVWLCI